MGTFHVARVGASLRPCYEEDAQVLSKMPEGTCYRVTYKRVRNLAHHRKFFVGLVRLVKEHHPVYDTEDKALLAIKLAAGHCDFFPNPTTGELVPVPKSISFDGMDQDDFDEFYEKAIQGVLDHLLPEFTRGDAERTIAALCMM